MKKNIITIITLSLLAVACNKPPASYSTAAPWGGAKPLSAFVDGSSFIADGATFINVSAANGLAAYSVLEATKLDSLTTDSIIQTRKFILLGPTNGQATGTAVTFGINNITDILNYSVKRVSYRKFNNGQVLSDKLYSSAKNYYTAKAKVFSNTGTEFTGNFFGSLRDLQDSTKYVDVRDGYFSILK
jgi:hypothetical protein